jgi:hypothetical protein
MIQLSTLDVAPLLLCCICCLLMATMTQLVSNTALTAMMVPVFKEMALNLDVRNNGTTQNNRSYHNFYLFSAQPSSPPVSSHHCCFLCIHATRIYGSQRFSTQQVGNVNFSGTEILTFDCVLYFEYSGCLNTIYFRP